MRKALAAYFGVNLVFENGLRLSDLIPFIQSNPVDGSIKHKEPFYCCYTGMFTTSPWPVGSAVLVL